MRELLKIARDRESHEEVFLARYGRLRLWALQFSENNRERAEDLVHDAFIQFTFLRPDLDTIRNLDGYLYAMLRNLNLSQVRRQQRLQNRTLSILDYDSAETSLRAVDPRGQIRLQDDLHQICRYACLRKETSKAGSVLILRFMHGYYPREIALLMRSSRQVVEERLRIARVEARQFLENPSALRFIGDAATAHAATDEPVYARTADELLHDLRRRIFQSCQSLCPASGDLSRLYQSEGDDGASAVDSLTLAHLVSCSHCLDAANKILKLPLLAERYPTDTLGTDTRPKDGRGGGGSDAGGAGSESDLRRCRKRARDVFEHQPQELCVSINGYLMAVQKIGAALNEQTISINIAEKIDFVEVFSEQEIRLLFLSVDELPPDGPYERSARVTLGDDRTLEATLKFSSPWPTVQIVYHNPQLRAAVARTESALTSVSVQTPLVENPHTPNSVTTLDAASRGEQREHATSPPVRRSMFFRNLWARLLRWFGQGSFWRRPGVVSAGLALLLVTALLLVRMHVPAVSAAELLRRSTDMEEAGAANPEIALHRTINLEERKASGGSVIARRRIEIWQSRANKGSLHRLYDEQGKLINFVAVGDQPATASARNSETANNPASNNEVGALLDAGDIWRIEVSAKNFSAMAGRAEAIKIEDGLGSYLLSYEPAPSTRPLKLLRATLRLNKADLHATQLSLLVERDGEAREYRFIETAFERHAVKDVPPEIFENADASAVRAVATASVPAAEHVKAPESSAPPSTMEETAKASAELEIEVAYLLNQIKANLDEQMTMGRTTGGTLRVEALVETEGRKEEILRALVPFQNNPAVIINIRTVAEALKQQRKESQTDAPTEREVEVATRRIPADAELRRYFNARLTGGNRVEEEIDQFAARALSRSRRALLHASALKRLVTRFSPEEVRALAPEARGKWLQMIREHANASQREINSLRAELRPVFGGNSPAGDAGATKDGASPNDAAERLLSLSYENDEAVRAAFTISTGDRAAQIKSERFWRALGSAEKLASAIQRMYQP